MSEQWCHVSLFLAAAPRLISVNLPLILCVIHEQDRVKEAEPTSIAWVKKQPMHILWHAPALKWFLKLSIIFFSYQSSLSLEFLLGVLHLYLGTFTMWPSWIPLSPIGIPMQILNQFTPVDFFSLSLRAECGSSLVFVQECSWSKNLITHMALLLLSPSWINSMGYLMK